MAVCGVSLTELLVIPLMRLHRRKGQIEESSEHNKPHYGPSFDIGVDKITATSFTAVKDEGKANVDDYFREKVRTRH